MSWVVTLGASVAGVLAVGGVVAGLALTASSSGSPAPAAPASGSSSSVTSTSTAPTPAVATPSSSSPARTVRREAVADTTAPADQSTTPGDSGTLIIQTVPAGSTPTPSLPPVITLPPPAGGNNPPLPPPTPSQP